MDKQLKKAVTVTDFFFNKLHYIVNKFISTNGCEILNKCVYTFMCS